MYDNGDDLEYLEHDERPFNEKLEREGGVFIEPQRGQVDCNTEDDCAPDDYPEDPFAIDNRPGTVDDVGYSMGLESTDAADLSLVPEGSTHFSGRPAPDVERDLEPGSIDEADLWSRMQPLIEEDENNGIRLPDGMTDDDGARVMEAMGDELDDDDFSDR